MTLIQGIFKNSGGVALTSGVVRVRLDAPLSDGLTDPDSYLLPIAHEFAIVNGSASFDLKESQTRQVSYEFTVLQSFTDHDYYKLNGDFYATNQDLPSHLHTDGKYYSGVSRSAESIPLERVARTRLETVGESFRAIVPNQGQVDFGQLQRTGFATDRLPQTIQQVADLLLAQPTFLLSLINVLVSQGTWNADILYRRGNTVLVGGSSYQCVAPTSINQPPLTNTPSVWQALALKGDPGGTGGNNAPFSAAWSGDLNAPSKNAIHAELTENRATKQEVAALAPRISPALSGLPTAPTQPVGTGTGTNRTALANCEYAERADAALIQLPISTILIASSPNPPTRTVRANGQAISRTTFSGLFAIIGTTFGTGDNTSTFNVPNIASPGTNLYYVIVTGV